MTGVQTCALPILIVYQTLFPACPISFLYRSAESDHWAFCAVCLASYPCLPSFSFIHEPLPSVAPLFLSPTKASRPAFKYFPYRSPSDHRVDRSRSPDRFNPSAPTKPSSKASQTPLGDTLNKIADKEISQWIFLSGFFSSQSHNPAESRYAPPPDQK